MRERLSQIGMCSGSRDLFIFWEISGDILVTVQDGNIVAAEY